MTLSEKSIESLKNKPEHYVWNYITALQQLQNALFELERDENNAEVLQDLSNRALEIGNEIEAILEILETKIED